MSLVVVGSMAFDIIETPFGITDRIVGGAASYIALCTSYFSSDVKIVSVVGNDFPQEFMDKLTTRGINLDGVDIKKDQKSFFWRGKYHNDLNTRDTL
ncbi:MAG: sugar kinase, partial [Sphingobacteriales bacterium]